MSKQINLCFGHFIQNCLNYNIKIHPEETNDHSSYHIVFPENTNNVICNCSMRHFYGICKHNK